MMGKPMLLQIVLLALFFQQKMTAIDTLSPRPPPKVILDADIDSDVDDVGALAMALNMHEEGVIKLIGVVVTSDDPYAPVCADAIVTYYDHSEVAVGFLPYPPTLRNHSRYTKNLAEEFPSRLHSWKDAENGVQLYRRLLAESDNDSVVIVTVGHLTTLMGLLRSQPDDISPLSGPELVQEKVFKWICMGGKYPSGKEANFYRPDPWSTHYLIEHWKKEVVFYGWELGIQVVTGGPRLKKELNSGHPVYRGYELFNDFSGRASWDQLALLELTDHAGHLFDYVRGRVILGMDASNSWEDDPSGPHLYVRFKPSVDVEQVARFTDLLMAGQIRTGGDFFQTNEDFFSK
jgi:purine nucleosidase